MTDRLDELVQAIAGNDAFRVGALLSETPDLFTARDPEGRTPLLLALYFRNDPLAALIRERIPKPDLFEAAALGESELVAELMDGAPGGPNAIAPDGFGILGLSVYFGQLETAELIVKAGANPNTSSANQFKVRPIHSAAGHLDAERSLELVRLLLDAGADPNVVQAGGWTPLHQAAAHGREECAKLLLEHGASLTAKSDDGRTPLEMARAKGHGGLEGLLGG
ncbi:MAG: ankyrin repeat domain-containing protein [Gemmatimonadetes bacterium]|nr:ankyrin repeat domain-containing protein [Gemmatimonadota bacterium]NNM03519.1 ankyrin repeat domain-containing protein [Gemmatimonadota bacterium]